MFRLKNLALLLGILEVTGLTAARAQEADVIVLNADIRTVDPARPRAQALAVRDGRFIAVGPAGFVNDLRGPKTQVIDARGRTLIPGIADAHTHLFRGAELRQGLDLFWTQNFSAWLEAIRKRDGELPKGSWLIGGRWNANLHMPTRHDLDAIVPDRPVALYDMEYHMLWVNSKALELAGINAGTKAPEGGEIVLDDKGQPTGILKETAAQLVLHSDAFREAVGSISAEFIKAVQHYNSLGITSAHDMSYDLGLYEKLMKENSYNLRIWFGLMAGTDANAVKPESFAALAAERKRMNAEAAEREKNEGIGPKFRFGYLKYFIDGSSLELHDAALNQPYADRPDSTGTLNHSPEAFNTLIANANNAGFPTSIHAIGDRAVDVSLDAYAQSPGRHGLFNRIEHIEVYSKGAASRFHELGIVASMQPDHGMSGNFQESRLGKERLPRSYAWQAILAKGGMLVLGSDWPTTKENPMLLITDAVLRKRNGKTWYKENALSFDEALYAYTQAPAIVSGWQDELGSISVGKWADFVILQGTIKDNPMPDIRNWKVDQTWFAGKKVYERVK